jgi:hypothetical protein
VAPTPAPRPRSRGPAPRSRQRPAPVRGRSSWAPRLAVLSTIALLGCLVVSGAGRSLMAFLWVSLALAAMVCEFLARRRGARGTP